MEHGESKQKKSITMKYLSRSYYHVTTIWFGVYKTALSVIRKACLRYETKQFLFYSRGKVILYVYKIPCCVRAYYKCNGGKCTKNSVLNIVTRTMIIKLHAAWTSSLTSLFTSLSWWTFPTVFCLNDQGKPKTIKLY